MGDNHRIYQDFDPSKGWPAGDNLFYECTECGETIPSFPSEYVRCRCGNMFIDLNFARMCVRDETRVRLFSRS